MELMADCKVRQNRYRSEYQVDEPRESEVRVGEFAPARLSNSSARIELGATTLALSSKDARAGLASPTLEAGIRRGFS